MLAAQPLTANSVSHLHDKVFPLILDPIIALIILFLLFHHLSLQELFNPTDPALS